MHEWYAQLPTAYLAAGEPAGTLPIEGLLRPLKRDSAGRPAGGRGGAWRSLPPLRTLLALVVRKAVLCHSGGAPSRPWVRHLLG